VRYVFLDIDGVLNAESDFCSETGKRLNGPRCSVYIGIGSSHMKALAELIDLSGAEVVLASSWKGLSSSSPLRKYMLSKFRRYGVRLSGDTQREEDELGGPDKRGAAIKLWLSKAGYDESKDSFVILDDEEFDYAKEDLKKHLVKTFYYYIRPGGFQKRDVPAALKILGVIGERA
jgi:hypothetical protein